MAGMGHGNVCVRVDYQRNLSGLETLFETKELERNLCEKI